MFFMPEQISTATKTNLEAQLALAFNLTNKAYESMEKLLELNLNVAKASLEDTTATARQLLSAKDSQEALSLAATRTQPNAEKVLEYVRNIASIATNTHTEFTKAAENQISETYRKMTSLVEEITKNAPAGSENAVVLLKSAIGNANAGYEQFSKTTKQAVEAMESNITTVVTQFSQAAEKAVPRAAKK